MSIRPLVLTGLALATLGAASPALAQFPRVAPQAPDYVVEFAYDWWNPSPELALTPPGATPVDLVNTFGLEQERFRQWALNVRPGRKHKVRFQRVTMSYDQAATLAQAVTFSGRTYPAQQPASLLMEWKLTRAGYEWDVVSAPGGYLGIIGEVKYNQVLATIAADGVGSASVETTAPIPAIGVAAGGYLVPRTLSVDVEVTGFQLPEQTDREARFIDYDLRVTAHLGRSFGLRAGYRSVDARYLVDGDRGGLKMKGPYFGVGLRF